MAETKKVGESASEATHLVLPSDTNALGTIFGGRLVSWIDLIAAIVAERHTRCVCVTASMDDLDFFNPVKQGDIVVLKAAVNHTGTTSLEVGVRAESEDPLTGKRVHVASAYLTFVALDEQGRPAPIPPLVPETAEAQRRNREAVARREARLKRAREKRNRKHGNG